MKKVLSVFLIMLLMLTITAVVCSTTTVVSDTTVQTESLSEPSSAYQAGDGASATTVAVQNYENSETEETIKLLVLLVAAGFVVNLAVVGFSIFAIKKIVDQRRPLHNSNRRSRNENNSPVKNNQPPVPIQKAAAPQNTTQQQSSGSLQPQKSDETNSGNSPESCMPDTTDAYRTKNFPESYMSNILYSYRNGKAFAFETKSATYDHQEFMYSGKAIIKVKDTGSGEFVVYESESGKTYMMLNPEWYNDKKNYKEKNDIVRKCFSIEGNPEGRIVSMKPAEIITKDNGGFFTLLKSGSIICE